MAGHQEISDFLKAMAIPAPLFAPNPGLADSYSIVLTHMGVQVGIQVVQENYLVIQIFLGYPPKANVAPFLRHILGVNAATIGVYFCIFEANEVMLRTARQMEGLELAEFRFMLDTVCATFWQHMPNIGQTFQLSATPN